MTDESQRTGEATRPCPCCPGTNHKTTRWECDGCLRSLPYRALDSVSDALRVGDVVRSSSGLAEIRFIDESEEYPVSLRYTEGRNNGATGGAKREELTFVSRPTAQRSETVLPTSSAWQDEDDRPLPEDVAISAAFPTRSGRHDLYAEAMRLVGAKYSKQALVALVNWLLHRIDATQTGSEER